MFKPSILQEVHLQDNIRMNCGSVVAVSHVNGTEYRLKICSGCNCEYDVMMWRTYLQIEVSHISRSRCEIFGCLFLKGGVCYQSIHRQGFG